MCQRVCLCFKACLPSHIKNWVQQSCALLPILTCLLSFSVPNHKAVNLFSCKVFKQVVIFSISSPSMGLGKVISPTLLLQSALMWKKKRQKEVNVSNRKTNYNICRIFKWKHRRRHLSCTILNKTVTILSCSTSCVVLHRLKASRAVESRCSGLWRVRVCKVNIQNTSLLFKISSKAPTFSLFHRPRLLMLRCHVCFLTKIRLEYVDGIDFL